MRLRLSVGSAADGHHVDGAPLARVRRASDFLLSRETSQDLFKAHTDRVEAVRHKPPGIVSSWSDFNSLEDGWTNLRRQLAYPRYGPGPEPYETDTGLS